MKKILLVDTWNKGHHINYALGHLKALSNEKAFLIFPENINMNTETIILKPRKQYLSLKEYIKLHITIKKAIKKYQPDVIHFLTGDYLLRFGGIGLSSIHKKTNIIISFHQFHGNPLKNLFIKNIFNHIRIGLVHSHIVKDELECMGIKNIRYLTYPYLGIQSARTPEEIRKELDIPKGKNYIGYFGATRYDKGLDILLNAIEKVHTAYFLLIAGQPTYFDFEYIQKKCQKNKNIKMILRYLTDMEMADYINSVDVIILPYRKGFNGASGPLVEGIAHKKMIIGPNDGSLGEIIRNYDLGELFKAEDENSLADAIDKIFTKNQNRSSKYLSYQKNIMLESYVNNYRTLIDDYL